MRRTLPFAFVLTVGAALGAATLVGCRDVTNPAPFHVTPALLSGTWDEEDQVPGSSQEWNLSVDDTVITGTGGVSFEACCGATLQILGRVRADSIVLAITSSGGGPFHSTDQATHYVGRLIAQNEMLVFYVTTDPTATPFRMQRTR